MTALLMGSTLLTCLGDGPATFAALLAGRDGRRPLHRGDPRRLRVTYGYHVEPAPGQFAASDWLARCVRGALRKSGVDPARSRVACVVGTGLRELPTVEDVDPVELPVHRLHFADAVRAVAPGVREVVTLANACAASGHALALAQDMVELADADAVVVAGADAMTESMLAMIGKVADQPTERIRPFDTDRQGVLLGDGGAAVVVVPDDGRPGADGRLLATGLSCDAYHETAPSPAGIARAMRDALARGRVSATDVALVVAHGTGTALNDPAECAALAEVLVRGGGDPVVTGIKGAVGHMSGTAALANLDVALRSLCGGLAPPVVGLTSPLPEAAGLRLAARTPVPLGPGVAQVNAFGFGGVNAVTLVAAP
ncbi:beta-ketoacyl synthase N-terminal-like domain-containing protein [Plantactinospora sp. WMMC1484]|uniref:beta-ketoacyl synthase N-terminal-like domain-containing protein n=1 Tax=Plantactinospora sp. WMMC1484 TaxID=3404122 RepID=UPI003BF56E45